MPGEWINPRQVESYMKVRSQGHTQEKEEIKAGISGFCRKFIKERIYGVFLDIIILQVRKTASKKLRFPREHSDLFESYGIIQSLLMWSRHKQSS